MFNRRASFPTGQDWLIKTIQSRGFNIAVAGLCFGVAQMAMQALLADDLAIFEERLLLILSLYQKNVEISAAQLLDIDAFINGILLYAQPAQYYGLFDHISGPQLQETATAVGLAISNKLRDDGGIYETLPFCGSYTTDDLKKYFAGLRKAIQNQGTENFPHALILRSSDHAITLSYDKNRHEWLLLDINHAPSKRFMNEGMLAHAVHHSLTKTSHAIFSTTIYSGNKNKSATMEILDTWKNSNVTHPHANICDHTSTLLLRSAVMNRDLPTARQLLATGIKIDADESNDKMPLLYAAAYKGDAKMAALLLSYGADINAKLNADGTTPLMVAAMQGHTDVVIELLKHKPDIDALSETDGLTAADMARYNGHYNTLSILENYTNPTFPASTCSLRLFLATNNSNSPTDKILCNSTP